MKANQDEFFPSNYLNAKSAGVLNGKTLIIYEVKKEVIRDKLKLLVGFESVEKMLVVNKTNFQILTDAFGEETKDWYGKKVTLGIIRVQFEGKLTPSIILTPVTDIPGSATNIPAPTGAELQTDAHNDARTKYPKKAKK